MQKQDLTGRVYAHTCELLEQCFWNVRNIHQRIRAFNFERELQGGCVHEEAEKRYSDLLVGIGRVFQEVTERNYNTTADLYEVLTRRSVLRTHAEQIKPLLDFLNPNS